MRIRILEPQSGRVDGVDMSVFQAGHVYEVDPSIASFLIVSGVAEACANRTPALVVRSDEVMVSVFVGAAPLADVADDWDDDGPEPAA